MQILNNGVDVSCTSGQNQKPFLLRSKQQAAEFMCVMRGMPSTAKPPREMHFFRKCLVLVAENEGMSSARRPPLPLYLGSLRWKVSRPA